MAIKVHAAHEDRHAEAFSPALPILNLESIREARDAMDTKMPVVIPESSPLNQDPSALQGIEVPMDFNVWLPFCAPLYHISAKVEDYLLTPVIVMPSGLPNRNSVSFPLEELIKFHPHLGQMAYKAWKGKPVYYEHANTDITKAYGVIVDAYMRKLEHFGNGKIWKVILLLAIDTKKHPEIADKVRTGELNSYSMGAELNFYTCSYCGGEVGKNCSHINPKGPFNMYKIGNKLVYKEVRDIVPFECSIVGTPAYLSAISDTKFVCS